MNNEAPRIEELVHILPLGDGNVAGFTPNGRAHILHTELAQAIQAGVPVEQLIKIDARLRAGKSIKTPTKKPPKIKLITELKMDMTDLLMALFKKQPRVIRSGYYTSEPRGAHGNMRERERATNQDLHNLYFKGNYLGYVQCRGHKKLVISSRVEERKKRTRYSQALLARLVHDLLPQVTIVYERVGQPETTAGSIWSEHTATGTHSVTLTDLPF